MTGDPALIEIVTDLFMNARDGPRSQNEAEQLAAVEFASCLAFSAVRNVLTAFRIGQSQYETMELMLTAGPRATGGHASPSMRRIERGGFHDHRARAMGTLTSRSGFVVNANVLPREIADYVDRLVTLCLRAAYA